jgi:Brp/Blh family beta-carotene 15,15'-monooxygenase
MGTSFYILLISNLLIQLVNLTYGGIVDQNEIWISTFLIAFIGIPHGAVDHIIFLNKTKRSKVFFYSFYLFLILLYASAWFYYPKLSLFFFLLLSAYHFGQSQMQQYGEMSTRIKKAISFFWGTTVISGFVVIHVDDIIEMTMIYQDFGIFRTVFNFNVFTFLFCSSLLLLISLLYYVRNQVNLLKETIYFLLIMTTFLWQSPFIGFSLFFVFNHSFEVLQTEHSFISTLRKDFKVIDFLKALTPFTILSLTGIALFYFLAEIEFINLSVPFLALVSISSITLPHAVVMEIFYSKQL